MLGPIMADWSTLDKDMADTLQALGHFFDNLSMSAKETVCCWFPSALFRLGPIFFSRCVGRRLAVALVLSFVCSVFFFILPLPAHPRSRLGLTSSRFADRSLSYAPRRCARRSRMRT